MSNAIRRELLLPHPPQQVWDALATAETLAQWMFPNDFQPHVGHCFTFRVPPNPAIQFEGLSVRCEVLECRPPSVLAFSWSAGGAVENTRVSYQLHPEGAGTRLTFEHTGFNLSEQFGGQALKGAQYGWARMHNQLAALLSGNPASHPKEPA